jgi:hypothetical protein
MGRTVSVSRRRSPSALIVGIFTLFVACLAPAVLAPAPAAAQETYLHGIATTCGMCHKGPTPDLGGELPTDTACSSSCHLGFVSRGEHTCTSCHDPGQDQAAVQTPDGCAASNCHLTDPHYGATTEGCTASCHTTASPAAPNGSAHHTTDERTAPTIDTCDSCHVLHEPFIPDQTCFDCHAGYDVEHPAPASITARDLSLLPTATTVAWGNAVGFAGWLLYGAAPFPGAPVTLQAKPVTAPAPAQIGTTCTGLAGDYGFDPLIPTAITTYRTLTPGVSLEGVVVKPSLASVVVSVRPRLTIGLSRSSLPLGATITVKGRLTPARPGGYVKLTYQRKVDGVWRTVLTKSRAVVSTADYSAYSHTYKPLRRGSWRVRASVAATTTLIGYKTVYKYFAVK